MMGALSRTQPRRATQPRAERARRGEGGGGGRGGGAGWEGSATPPKMTSLGGAPRRALPHSHSHSHSHSLSYTHRERERERETRSRARARARALSLSFSHTLTLGHGAREISISISISISFFCHIPSRRIGPPAKQHKAPPSPTLRPEMRREVGARQLRGVSVSGADAGIASHSRGVRARASFARK